MIKLRKRLLTAGLCIAMTAALLAGCGSNAGKAIATLDGEKVDFALANFYGALQSGPDAERLRRNVRGQYVEQLRRDNQERHHGNN